MAAACLARLAPHAPAAHPDRWWGMLEWTPGAGPVRDPGAPVALSGSSVAGYETCPLSWFFDHEARAAAPQTSAQGFGSWSTRWPAWSPRVRVPADPDAVTGRLDTVWGGLGFEAPWYGEVERAQARAALARFLRWAAADRGRTLVGSELPFAVEWSGRSADGARCRRCAGRWTGWSATPTAGCTSSTSRPAKQPLPRAELARARPARGLPGRAARGRGRRRDARGRRARSPHAAPDPTAPRCSRSPPSPPPTRGPTS